MTGKAPIPRRCAGMPRNSPGGCPHSHLFWTWLCILRGRSRGSGRVTVCQEDQVRLIPDAPDAVAASSPSSPAEDLRRGEQVIVGQVQFAGPPAATLKFYEGRGILSRFTCPYVCSLAAGPPFVACWAPLAPRLVSVTIKHGLPHWPENPPVILERFLELAPARAMLRPVGERSPGRTVSAEAAQ
jgi:hypothetical protein